MRFFEGSFRSNDQEVISIQDLPSPITEELNRHSIVPDDIKRILVSNVIQNIDGR